MRILKRDISAKDGAGSVKLRAEEAEDMWHTYHLVAPGDRIRTSTLRKVVKEGSTGSVTSAKVKLTLTLSVKRVEFDAESCTLHVCGPNVEESEHVRLGAFHTIHLELNRDFTIEKDCWDVVCLERLTEAADPERGAEVAAIAMEAGMAILCIISGSLTITKAKLDVNIPKKRSGGPSQHGKALERFYSQVHAAVSKHIDLSLIKVVLVGSPGFVAADFCKHMFEAAVRNDERVLIENRAKFVVCKASCGHKRAIQEMLATPEITAQLMETKVVDDVREFERFTQMLKDDPDRAYYGFKHVSCADENLAIDTLMVTDTLFKSCDVASRKAYVALCESVKEHGGVVKVFSSLHVSGEQLSQVSGIAAVLRFPMPDDLFGLGLEDGDDDAGGFDHGNDSAEDDFYDFGAGDGGGNNRVFSAGSEPSMAEAEDFL